MAIDPKALNRQFAAAVVKDALSIITPKLEARREAGEMSTETWYTVEIPFEKGSPAYVFYNEMLARGSMKDPNYIDLFGKVLARMKEGLANKCSRVFVTLNCRFDGACEDNFLLYVFTS